MDLKQNELIYIKAQYVLVGFGKDIIVTNDNIIHCITNKNHSKINASELIREKIKFVIC